MADLESLDLGFAEFVAKLISEVVDAVAASQLEQEQRQAELSAAARLSPEEFGKRYVTEAEVDAEVHRRFPDAEPGDAKLSDLVRREIAEQRLAALGELIARGVGRVLVDSGRVNAKLTFQVVTLEEVEAEPRPLLAAPLRPIGALTGTPERLTLPDVRLVVRQADDRSPQASTIQANVYGEVDVTFKTVT